jgi:hypothetical protein
LKSGLLHRRLLKLVRRSDRLQVAALSLTDAVNHFGVRSENIKQTNAFLRLLFFAFVIVCVFDPADRILGIKIWLFAALWGCACMMVLSASSEIRLRADLLIYVLLFIVIPFLSIIWYYFVSGAEPYAGFALIKSYVLVSLAIVLVISRIDLIPILSAALTVLALLTIAVFILVQFQPGLFSLLHDVGESAGVMYLSQRTYGAGLVVTQVTFVVAPMLAVSIPHYFDRAVSETVTRTKLLYVALTAIAIVGMFLAGLRNTMAVALLLPFALWPIYTKRVALNALISLGALIVFSLPIWGKITTFLDPAEASNSIKLSFLGDYASIFSNPVTLLFGQGLGAYYPWINSGQPAFEDTGANFYFITELTYAEMIRSFGLVGALPMMMLLLFPVGYAFFGQTPRRQRALAIGFLAYLGMSTTNPLLFSSSGILILSALIANIYQMNRGNGSSVLSLS